MKGRELRGRRISALRKVRKNVLRTGGVKERDKKGGGRGCERGTMWECKGRVGKRKRERENMKGDGRRGTQGKMGGDGRAPTEWEGNT